MRGTNFTRCEQDYAGWMLNDTQFRNKYGWNGSVYSIPKNPYTQISYWACTQLCGTGVDYYPWQQISSTISTWVLPIIGVLVQAPFASNAFVDTVFTIARWIGSPMASLSYLLWNIRVTGRAALMVDRSSAYNDIFTDSDSDSDSGRNFSSIRDSFYLLTAMNQYSLNRDIHAKIEAEGLLRIVLFSKNLRVLKKPFRKQGVQLRNMSTIEWDDPGYQSRPDSPASASTPTLGDRCEPDGHLNSMRQKLAYRFRRNRRRGIVPVFISIMWFLFSLAISIQDSFGYLGENTTAHDLALGCLLCWIPVLILCGIVDRNPVSSDDVQDQLNKLVETVRASLADHVIREDFLRSITNEDQQGKMRKWTKQISSADLVHVPFFQTFAGQGRLRWHYGVAHPILTDIESAYVKKQGRNWLKNEDEARHYLVLGQVDKGLDWFDYRELWQVLMAVLIVVGCVSGAWIISYQTPTVGLGCRSGGYSVFVVVSLSLLAIEMITWWLLDAQKRRLKRETQRLKKMAGTMIRRTSTLMIRPGTNSPESRLGRVLDRIWQSLDRIGIWPSTELPVTSSVDLTSAVDLAKDKVKMGRRHHKIQQWLSYLFFRPLEFVNMGYLIYLTMAQTLGADETCTCMASTWTSKGGYIDFTQWNVANSQYVRHFWIVGTTITTFVMSISMIYIIMEWSLQSHLSTADMKDAAAGLQNTRRFRALFGQLPFKSKKQTTPEVAPQPVYNILPTSEGTAVQIRVTSPPEESDSHAKNVGQDLPAIHIEDVRDHHRRHRRNSRSRGSRDISPGSISEASEGGELLSPHSRTSSRDDGHHTAVREPFPPS